MDGTCARPRYRQLRADMGDGGHREKEAKEQPATESKKKKDARMTGLVPACMRMRCTQFALPQTNPAWGTDGCLPSVITNGGADKRKKKTLFSPSSFLPEA